MENLVATVLIVDDSSFVLRHHAELAQQAGLEVYTAKNGEIAIDLFTQHNPNIVLCDIMMPEMDGYEVLQILKEIDTNVFFYFISAEKTDRIVEKAKKFGAQGVIMKPINLSLISNIMQEYQKKT